MDRTKEGAHRLVDAIVQHSEREIDLILLGSNLEYENERRFQRDASALVKYLAKLENTIAKLEAKIEKLEAKEKA